MAELARSIFLLTDFGARDTCAGQVRAVIAGIAPASVIHDLTHEVAPFAVAEGAWLLQACLDALPADAVVLAVVDPGVGTARRALAVQRDGRAFVGPDNGALSAALTRAGAAAVAVHELTNPALRRPHVSATFHGRDVFAPAAAHLAIGVAVASFGPAVQDPVALPPFRATPGPAGALCGSVIHIDRYGNATTTILAAEAPAGCVVDVAGTTIAGVAPTFGDRPRGTLLCYADSSGYLAIAVNQGDAAAALGLRTGDAVVVRPR